MDDSNTTTSDPTMYFRRSIIFGILTALVGPSILCYLYIFIQFSCKYKLCRKVHRHLVLVILIFSFVQVLIIEYFEVNLSFILNTGHQ
jgi:hypothetical protein